jgi:hypothetical protein
MEPVGALTWNHIVGVAGGVQNISQFIQDSVTTAINNGSQDESFALNVVTNANTGQGVQVAVFRFQLRQPQ